MGGQRTTALALSFDPLRLGCRVALLLLGLGAGDGLLELLQGQSELTRIDRLGALAELHALQLTDDLPQPVVLFDDPLFLGPLCGELTADAGQFGTFGRQHRLLRRKCGVQRVQIGEGRGGQGHGHYIQRLLELVVISVAGSAIGRVYCASRGRITGRAATRDQSSPSSKMAS
jgi:hypothetical protein